MVEVDGAPEADGGVGDLLDAAPAPEPRRCETCGAPLRYDPATGALRCRHCRAEAPIGTVADPVFDLHDPDLVADGAPTGAVVVPVRLRCAACGAPAEHPANSIAGSCPYCQVPFVGGPAAAGPLRPTGVVPLRVTEEQARQRTRAWLGSRWFAPRRLATVATGALRSAATPAWVFSMATTAHYRGSRGDDHTELETVTVTHPDGSSTVETRSVTRTSWRSADGAVDLRFRDVTAFAGTDPLSTFGEELEPWGVDDTVPYHDDHLRGLDAFASTAPPAAGLARARQRTADRVEEAIRADIGGDHQRIERIDRHDRDIRFRYLLLPGWEASYEWGDDTYRIAVNGRTGEVVGTRPYSRSKIAAAVIAAIAALAAVVGLLWWTNRDDRPSGPPPSPTTTVPVGPSTAPRPPTTPPVTISLPDLPTVPDPTGP